MITTTPMPSEITTDESAEWYAFTPLQRWQVYLQLGGYLDPEPDTQSLFFWGGALCSLPAQAVTGLCVLRCSGG
jgi:hypothetical protein